MISREISRDNYIFLYLHNFYFSLSPGGGGKDLYFYYPVVPAVRCIKQGQGKLLSPLFHVD